MLYVFLVKFVLKDAATMHPISSEALKKYFLNALMGHILPNCGCAYILPSPIVSLGAALDLKFMYMY